MFPVFRTLWARFVMSPVAVFAAYAATVLIWGTTWLGIKVSLAAIPPIAGSGFRFILAAGVLYAVALLLQLALLGAAALAGTVRARPLLIARYYVLTTASPAAGLWDWLRHGTDAHWEAAEGTR